MAATPRWIADLAGTFLAYFKIGGTAGVRLKNSSANLEVKNAADSAYAFVRASTFYATANSVVLNEDAAGSGADWTLTLARPSSGQTAAWTFTYPTGPGTAGQVLSTDGSGNTSWISAASTTACITSDVTALAFGSGSTVTMFTLPANAVVERVLVYVDTAFDATGPATASIGIAGNTSKYVAANQIDLTAVGCYEITPGIIASGSTEALQIAFAAGTSGTAGAARVEVWYSIPQ